MAFWQIHDFHVGGGHLLQLFPPVTSCLFQNNQMVPPLGRNSRVAPAKTRRGPQAQVLRHGTRDETCVHSLARHLIEGGAWFKEDRPKAINNCCNTSRERSAKVRYRAVNGTYMKVSMKSARDTFSYAALGAGLNPDRTL
ncbi:hypothetical protein EGR_06382 [Echinococcus granulosus]|uniref:Uncharacterized protein n=1 Tax=Echinococcus granulosus TaxID=6210 RepID=W6UD42_ECHGR|nr:hypothetical protein EGR_06382 [Echinococcus granulosus]EUB58711.1 hypothetical protein EGR_06382 [Echinococcus granulosus]